MKLQIKTIEERTAWDQATSRLPHPHVLQSWEWGAFKARHGWAATHWCLTDQEDRPRAAALVLRRQLSRLPFSLLYVPKGPVLDHSDTQAWEAILAHLETVARKGRTILVKIDPDVSIENEAVLNRLQSRGWHPSREQIQFRNTMTIDLTQDEDALLSEMKSKWRYNIRLAGRRGVTVRAGDRDDLPLLYDMYQETSVRNQFVIRPLGYYCDAWGRFIERGLAHPLIAEVEGEAVSMAILFRFGQQAWYMYGASRDLHRDKMPNHLLQWQAMRWAKSVGCTVYDMWGAPDALNEDDSMWGVYRFKQGFGAKMVRHVGAFDYSTSRFWYWVYTAAMPRLLAFMRRRYWDQVGT